MKKLFLLFIIFASPLFPMDDAKGIAALIEMCSIAAANGNLSELKALWEEGNADRSHLALPNAQGATPVFLASQEGHTEIVKWLLSIGVVTASGTVLLSEEKVPCTALHIAANKGHLEIVEQLINEGAHVNSQHALKKQTPLHCAIAKGHTKIVALLLANKAKLFLKDTDNNTPLNVAERHGYKSVLLEMIKEQCVLIHTVQMGNVTQTQQLIAFDANLEERDSQHLATPLIWAAMNGHGYTTQLLINAGANLQAQDKDGLTALDYAKKRNQPHIVRMLENALKKIQELDKGEEETQ